MASSFTESTSEASQSSSSGINGNNDAASFECNICFELAQDPIVTLCGHLYCWPCLYKWIHIHAQSQECPVCKAVIVEEKLVPLYGRGKAPSDPRSRSIPGVNIPNRPTGQRPETAPQPGNQHFPHHQHGFGFMGGLGIPPVASARWGNLTLSFGGLFPTLFNFHMHGFQDAAAYGSTAGFHYGFPNAFHGGHAHGIPHRLNVGHQSDSFLKTILLIVGIFVIMSLVMW